jgi:hypothetical protein
MDARPVRIDKGDDARAQGRGEEDEDSRVRVFRREYEQGREEKGEGDEH